MDLLWDKLKFDPWQEGLVPRKCHCGQNLWRGSIQLEEGEFVTPEGKAHSGKEFSCPSCGRIYYFELRPAFHPLIRWILKHFKLIPVRPIVIEMEIIESE